MYFDHEAGVLKTGERPRAETRGDEHMRELTPGKTVAEQVLELPNESVLLVYYRRVDGDGTRTVLHRTGTDGWLVTRDWMVERAEGRKMGSYLNNSDVERLLRPSHGVVKVVVLYEPEAGGDD